MLLCRFLSVLIGGLVDHTLDFEGATTLVVTDIRLLLPRGAHAFSLMSVYFQV